MMWCIGDRLYDPVRRRCGVVCGIDDYGTGERRRVQVIHVVTDCGSIVHYPPKAQGVLVQETPQTPAMPREWRIVP